MKSLTLLALVTPLVQDHYIFSRLIVNYKNIGGDYAYIRKNSNTYMPDYTDEIFGSTNLRCNKGGLKSPSQTYSVAAGDKIGFKIWNSEFIEHPGPGFVYVSKAPSSVSSYDGSGDWFKVYETGVFKGSPGVDGNWCSYGKYQLDFTIPKTVPHGEYLVRVEHIGLHEAHKGKAQFYMECARFNISGPGGGTPEPLVNIPGVYSAKDPGIAYDKWAAKPVEYVMPGPKVWTG